jgi:hypothetical protein
MTILGKNNKLTAIILLFLTLSLTSCFDVIQDVTVKENGSGKFALTVNLSKSKSQINKLLTQDSIRGFNVPTIKEINSKLIKLKSELSKLHGVSNVKIAKDFENFIFKLNFDFEDINNLNEAQLALAKLDPKIGQPIKYTYSGKEFTCAYSKELLKKADNELVKYKLGELRSADIITILRFDKKVKSCNGSSCKISKNGQTTFNKITAAAFIENQKNQSLTVTLK